MQTTVERVLESGIPEGVEVLRWMFKVCKNLWIDELRARAVRQRPRKAASSTRSPVSGEAVALGELTLREVERALARVSRRATRRVRARRRRRAVVPRGGGSARDADRHRHEPARSRTRRAGRTVRDSATASTAEEAVMTDADSPATDDEALSALLDGALPATEAALRPRLEREPALARASQRWNMRTRRSRPYRDVVDEPLPSACSSCSRASGGPRRQRRRSRRPPARSRAPVRPASGRGGHRARRRARARHRARAPRVLAARRGALGRGRGRR